MAPISRTLSLALIIKTSAFTTPTKTLATRVVSATNLPTSNNNYPTRQPMARRMIGSILDILGGGGSSGIISPDAALKGRDTPMPNIKRLKHYVLGNDLEEVPPGYEVAVFGNGCFWGSEKAMWRMPKGIHSSAVGYCAGFTPNPTYK